MGGRHTSVFGGWLVVWGRVGYSVGVMSSDKGLKSSGDVGGSDGAAGKSGDVSLGMGIQYVKGVGPRRGARFGKLGIVTVGDMLRHLPHRYEVERSGLPIGELVAEQIVSAVGEVGAVRVVGRGRKARFEATVSDGTGTLSLTWFNGGYLVGRLHPGMMIEVQGKTKRYAGYLQIVNAKWEVVKEEEDEGESGGGELVDRLRPIYGATEDLGSEVIDRVVQFVIDAGVLDEVEDHLPDEYRQKRELPELGEALRMIHRPEFEAEVAEARRRLVFDEFLLLQLGIALRRMELRRGAQAPRLILDDGIDKRIRERFPFELTKAQDGAIAEICADLARDYPMNRLLQGDVGSGKTVVALYAMLLAMVRKEHQAALMVPTEVLAEQHFFSISAMLKGSDVRIALLTGRMAAKEKGELQGDLAAGRIDLVIGTHALLSAGVAFKSLGLVVIDEQHRFGVEQRAALRERAEAVALRKSGDDDGVGLFEGEDSGDMVKTEIGGGGVSPHTLVMTATPIPRTMAITVFGDLDISTIRELPKGRMPVITKVVEPRKCGTVYDYVAGRVRNGGEQVYVVVPAIDESPDGGLKYVKEHAAELARGPFDGLRVGEMHGRMKRETRALVMERFRQNEIQVLVATTVIEVGVDVANATMMIVEHAERFGLSQLHQLRGRVGRGEKKSLCVFVAEPKTDDAVARMAAIAGTTDGFAIAEQDFEIRGMGEIFGVRQSGASPFAVAEFPRDFELLRLARRDALAWVERDPGLTSDANALLRVRLLEAVGGYFEIGDVG